MQETRRHTSLLPHGVFASLSAEPELFEFLLAGKPGVLEELLSSIKDTEFVRKHPLEEVHDSPNICMSIGIVGDDAGVFANQKVFTRVKHKTKKKHQTTEKDNI